MTFARHWERNCARSARTAGLSRQQLAERSGVHRNSIANYEGGADLPVMTFIRLCVAMGAGCAQTLARVLEK
jgi:transcriptional regulator with XRE-family HTH domain